MRGAARLGGAVTVGVAVAAIAGAGGSWLAGRDARLKADLRLTAIEAALTEALNRDTFKEAGAMENRVKQLEAAATASAGAAVERGRIDGRVSSLERQVRCQWRKISGGEC